jgi:hypothetical protein
MLASGGELLFCAHHGREHADALTQAAAKIQDESERLQPTPKASAEER